MGKGETVQLSGRLQRLADMVTPGRRVADVGCDHGFVSIYLVQKGISPRVIATDVRKGPLSEARKHVAEQGLEDYIETRLSDGLCGIRAGEVDALVCAGMGGKLMQRILKQGESVAKQCGELILQPQSELEEFRKFLRREHYGIVQEDILCEEGKYYFFMKVVPDGLGAVISEKIPCRLADRYGGLLLQVRHPVLREYLEFLRGTYRGVAEQIAGQAVSGERTRRRQEEIAARLADIEEALEFYCISPVPSGGAAVKLACKAVPTFGTTTGISK